MSESFYHFICASKLSHLKSNDRLLNVLSSIYAKENDYDDVLLINGNKKIVETTSGNVFIVKNGIISTPRLEDGCVDGVIRKRLLRNSNFKVL